MSASNDCSLLSYQDTFLSLDQDTNWFLVHSITSNNTTSTFYFFFLERERESQPTAFASNDYSLSSDHLIKSHKLFTLFLEHHINILLFFFRERVSTYATSNDCSLSSNQDANWIKPQIFYLPTKDFTS